MRRLLAVLILTVVAALGSCRDQDITTPQAVPPDAQFLISDAAHGGDNPDFFFLPPLVPNPVNDPQFEKDEFNPNLGPHIELCELNGGGDACIQDGEIVLTGDGQTALSAVLVPDEDHYKAEWDTGVSDLEAGKIYRIFAFVGSTKLGFLDVTPRTGGMKNAKTDDEFVFQDGRTLPVRFRIENGALCDPPGHKPCASSTIVLADGGSVVLEDTGDRIDLPAQEEPFVDEVTVTIRLCEDDIDVDLPTYGNCLDIRSDPRLDETTGGFDGFSPEAIVSMCNLDTVGDPRWDGLDADQKRLASVHRQNEEGEVQSLPHADDNCGEAGAQGGGTAWTGGVRGLAQRAVDGLRQGIIRLGAPRVLYARARVVRGDVGHGGSSPFISKFQTALPAQINFQTEIPFETPPGTTCVSARAKVTDALGSAVEGARVRFTPQTPGSSLHENDCLPFDPQGPAGPDKLVRTSDEDGIVDVIWRLEQDQVLHELTASGRGMGRHPDAGGTGPFDSCLPLVDGFCTHVDGFVALDLDAGSLTYTAGWEPMVEGVAVEQPKTHGHVLFLVAGGTVTLTIGLGDLLPNTAYRLHAFCEQGPLDPCEDMSQAGPPFIAGDHILDFAEVVADEHGGINRFFISRGLGKLGQDPWPEGTYEWHVNATRPGSERFNPAVTPLLHHIHGDIAFTIGSAVALASAKNVGEDPDPESQR